MIVQRLPAHMLYVDLDRHFVPVKRDEEVSTEIGRLWGKRSGHWLDWPALQSYQRVVLLAEAASGKTIEFSAQIDSLRAAGRIAFFARIEDIADDGLLASFGEINDPERFVEWKEDQSGSIAWFFLDSVDEARLNQKRFDKALRRFRNEVGSALDRANIVISCRGSDWRSREDRETIIRFLPAYERPVEVDEDADPLLDPIFRQ